MPLFAAIALVFAAGLVAWMGTRLLERHAAALGLVQPPNARSSHAVPTPRGGGLAIAAATILACLGLAAAGGTALWSIAALATLIAVLGFADDLRDLSPALRFPLQVLVLAALIWSLWPLPALPLAFGVTLGGLLLATIIGLAGLWWLNLFNFMDGIDGMAASQAVLILLGAALVWQTADTSAAATPVFWLLLASAAAAAGFLLRNWPPARIFMGDAGSNLLAFTILAAALLTIGTGAIGYTAWLILVSVFAADATVTLLRRLARRERPWQAHRRHAYQQLARRWGHRRVTFLYAALTAAWAVPLALAARHWSVLQWPLALLCYLPLIAAALRAGAGARAEQPSDTGKRRAD